MSDKEVLAELVRALRAWQEVPVPDPIVSVTQSSDGISVSEPPVPKEAMEAIRKVQASIRPPSPASYKAPNFIPLMQMETFDSPREPIEKRIPMLKMEDFGSIPQPIPKHVPPSVITKAPSPPPLAPPVSLAQLAPQDGLSPVTEPDIEIQEEPLPPPVLEDRQDRPAIQELKMPEPVALPEMKKKELDREPIDTPEPTKSENAQPKDDGRLGIVEEKINGILSVLEAHRSVQIPEVDDDQTGDGTWGKKGVNDAPHDSHQDLRPKVVQDEWFKARILNEDNVSIGDAGKFICVDTGKYIAYADDPFRNRFKYKWEEVLEVLPGYDIAVAPAKTAWQTLAGGRRWDTEKGSYAYNTIENMNVLGGLCGNGVNMKGKLPGIESLLPAPPGAIVDMQYRSIEYLDAGKPVIAVGWTFQFENEVNDATDVHCSSTGTLTSVGWTTTP